jgi:superkiller protein 3
MARRRSKGTAVEHCQLGIFFYSKGSYDLAIEQFILAGKRAPHAPNIWSNLGAVYIDKHDFGKARAALDRALALKPDYGAALFHLGQLYDEQGDGQKAEECFRRVMQIEPHTERGWRAKERVEGIKPRIVFVSSGGT